MYRMIMVLLATLMVGCGAHAPKLTPSDPIHIQHFQGETMVTFMGGPWLPNGDVAITNAAHDAVFNLLKAKVAESGGSIVETYCWRGKILRKDSDNTVYVLVKYETSVIVPVGTTKERLAQLSRL